VSPWLQAPELLSRLMDSAEQCMPSAPPPPALGKAVQVDGIKNPFESVYGFSA
jgi:hypothetical protein